MFLALMESIDDPFHCCVPHVAVGYLWLKPITHDKLVFIPRLTFDCAAARTSKTRFVACGRIDMFVAVIGTMFTLSIGIFMAHAMAALLGS